MTTVLSRFVLVQGTLDWSALEWTEKLLVAIVGLVAVALSFYVGKMWTRWRGKKELKQREAQMFNIEKALSDFFEFEKSKLTTELQTQTDRNATLEKQLDEMRRKAAGVTGKMSKDARADLILNTLIENQGLQEKLFQEHVRQKDERDRHLDSELKSLSYQRVLLSKLLDEGRVRMALGEILADDRKVAELQRDVPKLPESDETADPGSSSRTEGSA